MNRNGFIVSMLLAAAMLVAGCYNDNPVSNESEAQAVKDAAAQKILGKWIMKKIVTEQGESTDKYAILDFDADGKAVYNGTLDAGYEDMHEESTYKLGSDWKYNGEELSGHVYFKIWGKGIGYSGNDCFYCIFKDDEMILYEANNSYSVNVTTSKSYHFARSEFTEDTKDVSVLFQLQKENGEEAYTFNVGENIVFRLEIKNSGSETVVLPSQHELIGNNIFRVFSHADHKDMGTPWDPESGIYSTLLPHTLLSPNSSKVYLCPWLNKSETTLSPDLYSNFKLDGTKPLPAGDYYSEFDIKLSNTHKVTCKCSFKIKK